MKIKIIVLVGFFSILILFLPHSVDASTELTQSFIDSNASVSGGSYSITSDVFIPPGKEFVVGAGTALQFNGGQMIVNGTLNFLGDDKLFVKIDLALQTKNRPAVNVLGGNLHMEFANVSGLNSIFESAGGKIDILHSHFENVQSNRTFMIAYGSSTVTLADDSFSSISAPHVLEIYNNSRGNISQVGISKSGTQSLIGIFDGQGSTGQSNVSILDSTFQQSLSRGIEVFNGATLSLEGVSIANSKASGLLAHTNGSIEASNSSFEGNDIALEVYNSAAVLKNNSIEENKSGGIVAYGSNVNASNNWWGSATGPGNIQHNPNGGGQSITDDVSFDPWLRDKPKKAVCCSNILFIPGIEGSRLYLKNRLENQLWEPNTNGDVKKLFLDSNGSSIEKNIYTKDIIGKTNLTGPLFGMDVYEGFSNFLGGLVAGGTIAAWKAAPYDWRLSASDISSNIIPLGKGGTTTIENIFNELVATSKTGKVSIITHSNGGLVAKNFVRNLVNAGKGNVIDQLIMVAAPEFGTPQAIADMLHGDSQSILGGIILSKSTARDLAINMSAAYGLLPSKKYFGMTIPDAIMLNGNGLNSWEQMSEFLVATKQDRKPAKNVDDPAILNNGLLQKSEELHRAIDDLFATPTIFPVTSLVGIGNETMSGIGYIYETKGKEVYHQRTRITSNKGDGVVLAGEPNLRSGDVYAVDLKSLSLKEKKNYQHSNILSASLVQQMISALVKKNLLALPAFVSKDATSTNPWHRYEFVVHSPVTIMAYDKEGNRTGLLKEATEDEIGISLEEIPGSQYVNFGEAKTVITALPPEKIVLEGIDTGTFRFTATEFENDKAISEIEYSNVPTIDGMKAEFIPASSSIMSIDYNNDDVPDENLTPDNSSRDLDLETEIKAARSAMQSGLQSRLIRDKYMLKFDELLKLLQKGKKAIVIQELKQNADSLARALKFYNFLQKKLKIKRFVEPIVKDTTLLFYQFQRLSILAESLK